MSYTEKSLLDRSERVVARDSVADSVADVTDADLLASIDATVSSRAGKAGIGMDRELDVADGAILPSDAELASEYTELELDR